MIEAEEQQKRREKLIKALGELGLTLRVDSGRCAQYIKDPTKSLPFEEVIETAENMHIAYVHGNARKLIHQATGTYPSFLSTNDYRLLKQQCETKAINMYHNHWRFSDTKDCEQCPCGRPIIEF